MKLTRLSDIYIIYNKEDGDMYCAADSYDAAEQIIKEDSEAGSIVAEEMNIVDLHFWTLKNKD
jgi:hypothetical protein